MKFLPIIFILLTSSCGLFRDIVVPDIPENIADMQDAANAEAFSVLADLQLWLERPELIPDGSAAIVGTRIKKIESNLKKIRNWMLADNKVDKKVTQTVIDLLVAWQDYIYDTFCDGSNAWLRTKAAMSAEDNSAWLQVFLKVEKLHRQLREWMEQKGVIYG